MKLVGLVLAVCGFMALGEGEVSANFEPEYNQYAQNGDNLSPIAHEQHDGESEGESENEEVEHSDEAGEE